MTPTSVRRAAAGLILAVLLPGMVGCAPVLPEPERIYVFAEGRGVEVQAGSEASRKVQEMVRQAILQDETEPSLDFERPGRLREHSKIPSVSSEEHGGERVVAYYPVGTWVNFPNDRTSSMRGFSDRAIAHGYPYRKPARGRGTDFSVREIRLSPLDRGSFLVEFESWTRRGGAYVRGSSPRQTRYDPREDYKVLRGLLSRDGVARR